jgi:hypothetical protein
MPAAQPDPIPFCKAEIDRMLKNSQTKVIAPVITYALLAEFSTSGKLCYTDKEIEGIYGSAVGALKTFLGHDVHIGAKYYDAYGSRMSRYKVLQPKGHLVYQLLAPYTDCAGLLVEWIPQRIKDHIDARLGVVPKLGDSATRLAIAEDESQFLELLRLQITKTPANFEIFSFAVLKVHLEKFACKIYRDTRTSAHDRGTDLSTNFGVVYQVKKLRVATEADANRLYSELRLNFDSERLQDGNVILVIDEISREVKKYLVDMKVQSISKNDVLALAKNLGEVEARQKVLRTVYEEFRREYSSNIS